MLSRQLRQVSSRLSVVGSSAARAYSTSVVPEAEKALQQQAPNRVDTWAPSQRPRAEAQVGPRFEQHSLELQPRPYAAIDLIAKEPIRYVHDHSAVCDGGKGAQGHPKIFINLDKPGPHACLYCGLRYANEHHRAEIEAASA
ncbi:NADH:ubiquinone oxidoreductase 18.4kD subunit [Sugiyamaella lignohabitans]|uniref:NADH:ubiquinone oxidoreductase 18.4kD subunit n=1 Tax=Sugiyamaella lignohabitans TaxID=796027 RepID=A0A167FBG1_9ASCO|nr:NADH:ubiquinone oxidoreductase 18.4kD subunit [Sugiyamaella lignohabitans]ANB15068.1 NADH:ubiquinone oxidoreductase 18.4kD subunit [Sugiyamaella lignohabitans]